MQQEYTGAWKFQCTRLSLDPNLNVLLKLFAEINNLYLSIGFVHISVNCIIHAPNAWRGEFEFKAVCRVTIDYRLSHSSSILV